MIPVKQPKVLEIRITGTGTNLQLADSLHQLADVVAQIRSVEEGPVLGWQNDCLAAKFRERPELLPAQPQESQTDQPKENEDPAQSI